MRKIDIGNVGLMGSQVALGCMRISAYKVPEVIKLVETALKGGINFFDHADIYGNGESERVFGAAIKEMGVMGVCLIIVA
ncbi:MAG: hypothetical protein ATN35_11970 [Epulopiscium sp. Nele67-Bin004]|nr:MAG: hypothetical protein ATN35_11970 [Epulopiscium sp. Nele67-Bin004]